MELIHKNSYNMKTLNKILFYAFTVFIVSACTDIVEVDELLARKNPESTGTPEIYRVVLASDTLNEIDGANFEDMIRIEGKNLGNVTSIKFNDVEVSSKDFYAVYDMILAPVPRVLPKEVTDKLYITTSKGSLDLPFLVSIPELKMRGLYNEFAAPGDTTVIYGDNFDLYGITVEEAIVNLGNIPVNVLSADRTSLTIQIPVSATLNTVISIKGSQMDTPVETPYKQPGVSKLFNFNDWPGFGAFTHASKFPDATPNFLCTGLEGEGYPEPLEEGGKYVRFRGDVGAWGWMVLWAGYIKVPEVVASNPSAYDIRFELLTNPKYPLSTSVRIFFGDYAWYPATDGIPLNTYGRWQTISISADTPLLLPEVIDPASNTPFKIVFSPEAAQTFDISMTNFRFSLK